LTEDGETPYDLAIKHNSTECAEKLGKILFDIMIKEK